jgi:hypothetical protein
MARGTDTSPAEAPSHNVPPDVFLRHYREIRDLKRAHADTGMAVARAKKSAKSAGIDLDALKLLEKFAVGHERDINPNTAGSAEHVAWDKSWANGHKAWLKGQTEIAGQMKPNGAARTRKRPGSEAGQPAH